jgi:hypothetical protein
MIKKFLRSYKTVEIKVFLIFLLVDGRIRVRINNYRNVPGGQKTYGSGSRILFYPYKDCKDRASIAFW